MATLLDMGVRGNGGEILHPQMKNKWRLTFNGAGGLLDSQALTFQAITCDRPKLSFESVTLDRYNSRTYIAGKHQFDPINATFEADIGGGVSSVVRAQLERQQRIIGLAAAPRLPTALAGQDYKFSVTQEILDGDNTPLEIWYIEGVWIENADYTDLDYAASETIKIQLTLRYDHARQMILPQSGRATGGMAPII
ncbi:structural protein [Xanthomonas phage Xoo-sp13]|nr:structural protein [Xanthomonas phage Xoo-sp13]